MNKSDVLKMPPRWRLADPNQGNLDLVVERQGEFDGIGMGVLRNGTPFLNQRGLASLCGVQNRHIGELSREWSEHPPKPRVQKIKGFLEDHSYLSKQPILPLRIIARSSGTD